MRRDWKAKLLRQPELLEVAGAREPEVLEALEALHRRAAREPNGAAEAVLREVVRARGALADAIAYRRPGDGDAPLAERVARLGARLLQPSRRPPETGEHRLAEGNPVLPPTGVLTFLLPLAMLLGCLLGLGAAALLLALVAVVTYLSGRRYQLT